MFELEPAVNALATHLQKEATEPFPWREEHRPFLVLISEMMLMRTRADLVVDVFVQFAERYPTEEELAEASLDELEALLTPLGLVKRIPFFRKAARYICEHHPNGLPAERKSLEQIPGVGRYTADAILAFAFDKTVVPADVNVLRWISRVTGLSMTHESKGSQEIRALLPELAPLGGRRAYKLIDFVRNTCRPRKPRCKECPIRQYCHYGTDQRET